MGMWLVWCTAALSFFRYTGAKITQTSSLVLNREEAAKLTCSQTDNHSYMYWYLQQQGKGLQLIYYSVGKDTTPEGDSKIKGFSASRPEINTFDLNISLVKPEHSAVYFCASSLGQPVYFGEGTRLTVLEDGLKITAPTVAIFPPSKQEINDKKKATLVCLATDFYPDHIKLVWKVNGEERKEGVKTEESVRDESSKRYSLTSRLRVSSQEWFNSKIVFKCSVDFYTNMTQIYAKEIRGGTGSLYAALQPLPAPGR